MPGQTCVHREREPVYYRPWSVAVRGVVNPSSVRERSQGFDVPSSGAVVNPE